MRKRIVKLLSCAGKAMVEIKNLYPLPVTIRNKCLQQLQQNRPLHQSVNYHETFKATRLKKFEWMKLLLLSSRLLDKNQLKGLMLNPYSYADNKNS